MVVVSQRLGYWRIEAVRKIIRAFHGRPIIAWPISAAHGTGVVDHGIVSPDYPDIAEVAAREGAEVPFLSSDAFSTTGLAPTP